MFLCDWYSLLKLGMLFSILNLSVSTCFQCILPGNNNVIKAYFGVGYSLTQI